MIFLVILALTLIIKFWLIKRQQDHIILHQNVVPELFRHQVTLDAHQKATAYTQTELKLEKIELLISSALLIFLTIGGGLQRLDDLWQGFALHADITGLLIVISLLVIFWLIALPTTLWRIFVIEQKYGFNRTSPVLYIEDQIRKAIVTIIVIVPLVYSMIWLVNHHDTWWLIIWVFWLGFTLSAMWLYPVLIAPLFNKFVLLDDPDLYQRFDNLFKRMGLKNSGIFVMDGSKRSRHGNAYFTGVGRNKRIVIYDTLLHALDNDEIEAVLAHEVGHYYYGHIYKRFVTMAIYSLLGLILMNWLSTQIWFYNGLGVNQANAQMTLILFILCAPLVSFFLQPLLMSFSRRDEYQADDFSSQHSNAQHLEQALTKLYKDNAVSLTADSLYADFNYSHPTALARIKHLQHSHAKINYPENQVTHHE